MPPNLSVPPTPVLLTDQFNLTVPTAAPHFWIPDASDKKADNYNEMIGWIVFGIVAFFLVLYGIYLVVIDNSRRQRLQPQSLPLTNERTDQSGTAEAGSSDEQSRVGFDSQGTTLDGSPSSGSKVGLGTPVLSPPVLNTPRKSVRHGLDRFPEFDDRWFRERGSDLVGIELRELGR